jgi:hypothetical protein
MKIVKNPSIHAGTKHIEIHYHFIRKKVISGQTELAHVPTTYQLANSLTKSLGKIKLYKFRDRLKYKT